MKLILASGSPRRAELLERMGLTFSVQPAQADETLVPGLSAQKQVVRLSRIKAQAVAETLVDKDQTVILSADTVVVLDGKILGKPKDEADAARMLAAFSGRSHLVLTGVTVWDGTGIHSHCEETEVCFRSLSQGEIQAYIATGEPMDKAGAYGIQGLAALFVERLVGDYYNVMGLPVCATAQLLRQAGIPILGETV
jgi:septum formation protein